MHTPVCVCEECLIERHGLVGYLRIVAEKQERDWVATNYEPWLLIKAADRIAQLEAALRKIESNDMRYDLTACAQIARAALETASKQPHPYAAHKPDCDLRVYGNDVCISCTCGVDSGE